MATVRSEFTGLVLFLIVVTSPLSLANIVVGSTADTRGCVTPTPPYGLPFTAWDMPRGLAFAGWLSLSHLAFIAITLEGFRLSGHHCYLRLLRVGSAVCGIVGSLLAFANVVVLFSRTYGWCPSDSYVKLAVGNFFCQVVLVSLANADALGKYLNDA